ncbi:hypothetical protein Ancab_008400 [Ancistrocladus abbreviatus]
MKKSKRAPEVYTADFAEDQNAYSSKADEVEESRGPSDIQRKKAQDTPKGMRQNSRPSIDDMQNKEYPKKKQGQPKKKKEYKAQFTCSEKKRKERDRRRQGNSLLCDNTMAEEGSKDNSKLHETTCYRKKASNPHKFKKDYRNVEEHSITDISIGDSGIQNMNRLFLTNLEGMSAKKIWEASKSLGATFEGDEIEIIQKIQQMEERDRVEWSRIMVLGDKN